MWAIMQQSMYEPQQLEALEQMQVLLMYEQRVMLYLILLYLNEMMGLLELIEMIELQ
jgi:hypothetical protein